MRPPYRYSHSKLVLQHRGLSVLPERPRGMGSFKALLPSCLEAAHAPRPCAPLKFTVPKYLSLRQRRNFRAQIGHDLLERADTLT